jgi:hypothetical protein
MFDWAFEKINGIIDSFMEKIEEAKAVAEGAYDVITKPFQWVAQDTMEAADAVSDFASNPGWGTAANAALEVGDAVTSLIPGVGLVKNVMFGSSFLHIAEDLHENTLPAMMQVGQSFLDTIPGIEKMKKATSAAWDIYKGAYPILQDIENAWSAFWDEGPTVTISPEEQMAHMMGFDTSLLAGLSPALQESVYDQLGFAAPQDSTTPVYTVQFDDTSIKSSDENLSELVALQAEQVSLLSKILEKSDPNSERLANSMEKMTDIAADQATEVGTFRGRTGYGETATQWWVNK